MNSIQLVTFDLDGTLVDSVPDIACAVDLMAAELGVAPPGLEKVSGWVGDGVRRLVKRALTGERNGEPDAEQYRRGMESFRRYYREHLHDRTYLYPGVREVLNELHACGLRLACVTNKSGEFTQPLLEALDLRRYFGAVVSGDTLAQRKPDPAPLLYVTQQLGVTPTAACMVGDSANDMRAAQAAGFRAVAVTYGYGDAVELAAAAPDTLLDSLIRLPAWLAEQGVGLAGRAASR